MKPILYANTNPKKLYSTQGIFSKVKDYFNVKLKRKYFIKDLDLYIMDVNLPGNINMSSYEKNMERAKKICRCKDLKLAPRIYRNFDYYLYDDFQKKLMAFGICRSTRIILRNIQKSIRNSCIVVYDASDSILFYIICFLAMESAFIVLLSENMKRILPIREYVIANYGITPVVTENTKFFFENADFIITSRSIRIDRKIFLWNVCNSNSKSFENQFSINDVIYRVPWDFQQNNMNFEVLGSILNQMDETNVEKSLKYNGVFIDKIKLHEDILDFTKNNFCNMLTLK